MFNRSTSTWVPTHPAVVQRQITNEDDKAQVRRWSETEVTNAGLNPGSRKQIVPAGSAEQ